MGRRKLSILMLCDEYYNSAATVHDHINAISNSRHNVFLLDNRMDIPARINLDRFDVVVVHYTLILCNQNYISNETKKKIRNFAGLKACFIQDEYRFVNRTIEALKDLGMDIIFTCVPPDEIEKVYPQSILKGIHCVNVLTGYVPKKLTKYKVPKFENRELDISYRGRAIPFWLGELGQEKVEIAKKFNEDAKAYSLKVDIDYREEARIYQKDWIRFLTNSKACLGVESGASVFDFTGEIEEKVNQYLMLHPDASFEKVQKLFFKDLEGKIKLNQISPRCFEAASLRTLMILYEGDYSDILIPWRHYVPLKKDHSNIEEVVNILRNPALAEKIIDQAYREIALNDLFSYDALTKIFDQTIDEQLSKRQNVPAKKTFWLYLRLLFMLISILLVSKRAIRLYVNKYDLDSLILLIRRFAPKFLKNAIKKFIFGSR